MNQFHSNFVVKRYNLFAVKWLKVARNLVMVHYGREMTAKKSSTNNEYGLFEHLLFFFIVCNHKIFTN